MSEVNETADAAAEPKQASNISPSEFVNMRIGQPNAPAEEQENQTEAEEAEEEVAQEPEEATEVVAEEAVETDETSEEEPQEEEPESEDDVLSQIELDDMSDEELRELSDKLGSRAVARFGELTAKRRQLKLRSKDSRRKCPASLSQRSRNPRTHTGT